jgi:hypothetical protein
MQNLFFFIIAGTLFIFIVLVSFYLFQLKKRLDVFFKGTKAKDLEEVLTEQLKKLKKQEKDIKRIFEEIAKLDGISQKSFQKIGVIRYNPFKDAGGDQSFSISLLDAKDNGFVLTSLYSREGMRVYAKPIKEGNSEYPLSEEEKEVIERATDS